MKTALFFIILFPYQLIHAEVIVEKLSENKKWIANKIEAHAAWNTASCVASTPGLHSVLEVYSEKTPDGDYTEPTVQVLIEKDGFKEEAYSAEVSTESGKKFVFTRASTPADPNTLVLLSQLNDRSTLIELIKRDSNLRLKTKNPKGKLISDISFSLSGSSKTLTTQFEKCLLTFDVI